METKQYVDRLFLFILMFKNKRGEVGMPLIVGIVVVVSLILGGGLYFSFIAPSSQSPEQTVCPQDAKLCPDGSAVGRTGPNCEFSACSEDETSSDADRMMQDKEKSVFPSSVEMMGETPNVQVVEKKNDAGMSDFSYKGTRLAGTSAPLIDFNKVDYDAALQSGRLVVLYFYANWCPICRAEFPKMQEAFTDLISEDVIGFRVNYRDSETDGDEEALARQFGVAYQHTKVFLRGGSQIKKAPDSWDRARYLAEITQALSN